MGGTGMPVPTQPFIDVLFDGLPLISGAPVIDAVNEYLTNLYSSMLGSL